jgi:hypothetical protein
MRHVRRKVLRLPAHRKEKRPVTEDERLAERARRIHGNPFSPENMARDAKLNGIERDAVPIERTIEALKRHREDDEWTP